MQIKKVKTELVYEGKVFRIHIDHLEDDSGRKMQVDVVEHVGAVAIVALDESDRIWLVSQYRHPVQKTLLELPAGTLENGESPRDCAVRECQEEIGMFPGSLKSIGGFYLAPGYSSEYLHVFLAQDLSPARLPGDEGEDIQAESHTRDAIQAMIEVGEIQDAKTIAGLSLAAKEL
jgi:ADP-ribose pyrophosphatase